MRAGCRLDKRILVMIILATKLKGCDGFDDALTTKKVSKQRFLYNCLKLYNHSIKIYSYTLAKHSRLKGKSRAKDVIEFAYKFKNDISIKIIITSDKDYVILPSMGYGYNIKDRMSAKDHIRNELNRLNIHFTSFDGEFYIGGLNPLFKFITEGNVIKELNELYDSGS